MKRPEASSQGRNVYLQGCLCPWNLVQVFFQVFMTGFKGLYTFFLRRWAASFREVLVQTDLTTKDYGI